MREQYKKILETEYEGKSIFKHLKDGSLTLSYSYKGSKYDSSNSKLMVIGRAMNGWENDFSRFNSPDELLSFRDKDDFKFSHVINKEGFVSSGRKRPYRYITSKFWKLIKFLLEEYEDANDNWYDSSKNNQWNEKIVWSNLYKISPRFEGNPPWKIMIQNIEEYIEILRMEIEEYNPDRILFVTDNNYLEPDTNKSSFIKAFNIQKCDKGDIVGEGEYNGKKIIVCRRPDRRGMSNETIRRMAQDIKANF